MLTMFGALHTAALSLQSQLRPPPLPVLAKQWHEVMCALSCDVQFAWPQAHDFAAIAVYEANAYDGEGVAAELGLATLVGFKQQLYGCSPVMLQGQEVTFRECSRPLREPSSQLVTDPMSQPSNLRTVATCRSRNCSAGRWFGHGNMHVNR